MKTTILAIAILIAAIALSITARADGGASPAQRTIQVSGDGQVQAAPDLAVLNLAIETHAATAEEAAARNGALAQKVTDALKAKLGDKGKTWTGGYSLNPVGPLIDAAITAGANRVNSLDFNLRDDTGARNDAIARAAKDARSQAEALAAALDLKLGPIINASNTSNDNPQPVMFRAAGNFAAPAMSTPVSPAEVNVSATVSLTYG